ncbi:hypothetical protein CLU82_0308 [Flavobacterium sp. 5]|nr:hypothetical protein CLU82_0308 [Flavobacterium sp. 5]
MFQLQFRQNKPPVTAVTRDLGIWLNLKMVLYLENLCIMEKSRIFNPKPLVAPGRYATLSKNVWIHENIRGKIGSD